MKRQTKKLPCDSLYNGVGHGEETDEEVGQQQEHEEVAGARRPEEGARRHLAHARRDVAEVEDDDELGDAQGGQQRREEDAQPHLFKHAKDNTFESENDSEPSLSCTVYKPYTLIFILKYYFQYCNLT